MGGEWLVYLSAKNPILAVFTEPDVAREGVTITQPPKCPCLLN